MCGICGIFDFRNEQRVSLDIVSNMSKKIAHRGPDDLDYYVNKNIALGFRRLSIIDVEGGMQPIMNEDKSVVMVCNGEIFNYRELRDDLLLKGHKFRTNCDIEVIIHLYEQYGIEFIDKLNGQFAFVIHDLKKNILLCARDQVGIAPLFYSIVDGLFIFGSEIKSILEHPCVKRDLDLVALDQIFTFPSVIAPRTLFKNVKSLENGHYILINDSGSVVNREYWDLIYPEENEISSDVDEKLYIERLNGYLTKAVEYRLISDVPVGFYISGGLDSSIIASKINEISPYERRHSFSINFTQKDISEQKYQRLLADKVNSHHHEILFNTDDIASRLQKVIYHCEAPLKETYNTASLALSECVRNNNIKVIQSGEGADELFAGYVGYRFDKLRASKNDTSQESEEERRIRNSIWGDESFFYEKNYSEYNNIKRELYSSKINEIYDDVNCLNYPVVNTDRLKGRDALHKRSYIDYKLRLPEHLLAGHGDRMTFASSVEGRYPFLDKELINFAREIPGSLKLKGFEEKYILKKVAAGLIPDSIIKRPKFTFVAPGSSELLKLNIDYINDVLSSEKIKKQGYLNEKTIEKLKMQYSKENFKLNLPFENDLLIIAITLGVFIDKFNIPSI